MVPACSRSSPQDRHGSGYGKFSTSGNVGSSDYVTTAATRDGTLAVSYLPTGGTVTVDMARFAGRVQARWYDPANGRYSRVVQLAVPKLRKRPSYDAGQECRRRPRLGAGAHRPMNATVGRRRAHLRSFVPRCDRRRGLARAETLARVPDMLPSADTCPRFDDRDARRNALPLLRGAARADDGRSREVAALRELPSGGSARDDGAVLPAARARLHGVLARAAPVVRPAGRDLPRVRVLLRVFGLVGRACACLRRHDHEPPLAGLGELRRRARLQRRLPAAALRAERRARARHRPRGERRACGRGTRRPDARRVLRRRAGRAARRRARTRRPRARKQRARPGARSQRLRRRRLDPARARRHDDVRVPSPRPTPRRPAVRHDLPRALRLLLADDDPQGLRRARARRRRRRGARRATAARFASTARTHRRAASRPPPSRSSSRERRPKACSNPIAITVSPTTSRSRSVLFSTF